MLPPLDPRPNTLRFARACCCRAGADRQYSSGTALAPGHLPAKPVVAVALRQLRRERAAGDNTPRAACREVGRTTGLSTAIKPGREYISERCCLITRRSCASTPKVTLQRGPRAWACHATRSMWRRKTMFVIGAAEIESGRLASGNERALGAGAALSAAYHPRRLCRGARIPELSARRCTPHLSPGQPASGIRMLAAARPGDQIGTKLHTPASCRRLRCTAWVRCKWLSPGHSPPLVRASLDHWSCRAPLLHASDFA